MRETLLAEQLAALERRRRELIAALVKIDAQILARRARNALLAVPSDENFDFTTHD